MRNQNADRNESPFLRATIMESLRLWPTTPILLRQTSRETFWEARAMPPGTDIVIYTPFFHRDPIIPFADSFAPEL